MKGVQTTIADPGFEDRVAALAEHLAVSREELLAQAIISGFAIEEARLRAKRDAAAAPTARTVEIVNVTRAAALELRA